MKILDVIIEDAEAGTTMAGNIASVVHFLAEKNDLRAVGSNGYITLKRKN